MSKAETIAALRDSAIQVFSEVGYYGASLREIAAAAGVPLSTIHMYFGSKAALFSEVAGSIWRELEKDRSDVLARRIADGHAATLEDIAYALAQPVVVRLRSPLPELQRMPRLMRHWVVAPPEVHVTLREEHGTERDLGRWIELLAAASGSLSKSDAMWGFSFLVGTIYSWALTDRRYDHLVGTADERTAEDVTERLVTYAVGGLRAMLQTGTPTQPVGDPPAAGPTWPEPIEWIRES